MSVRDYKTDLKHLMAVMLDTEDPKKAAAVVSEVTSMLREAWDRVYQTSCSSPGGVSPT